MDTNEIFCGERGQLNNQIQSNFSDRQKNLFDQLQKAEDVNKNRLSTPITPRDIDIVSSLNKKNNKRKRSETKCLQGKESIFKRPEEPLSKCLPPRRIPDFRKNPHKWTKYSLDDVPNEDTSERANTAAALSFLREMEDRKQSENDTTENISESTNKVQFNKSALLQRKMKDQEKLSFRGTKIVMPEYVIGQAKKNTKKVVSLKNPSKSETKEKEIKLDHLNEEEDCDE